MAEEKNIWTETEREKITGMAMHREFIVNEEGRKPLTLKIDKPVRHILRKKGWRNEEKKGAS